MTFEDNNLDFDAAAATNAEVGTAPATELEEIAAAIEPEDELEQIAAAVVADPSFTTINTNEASSDTNEAAPLEEALPEIPEPAAPESTFEGTEYAAAETAAEAEAAAADLGMAPEESEPVAAEAATETKADNTPETKTEPSHAEATEDAPAPAKPGDTAEIDVEAVETKLNDPGSTMSFEPLAMEPERINADSTYDAGTNLHLMWGARSDVGCVRSHNEDSYLVQQPLFAVCDGMGGHAAGEVASSIAVETIARTAPNEADPSRLAAAVEAANAAVIEAAVNGLGKPGMGCTATCAYIEGSTLAIAHVGDSRAYLLHEGALIRVTHDHSYVEELVDAGEITADEARVHPNRSVITRALGSDPAMYADHFSLAIEEGDRLILCSDGLSSMIPDYEIETIANQSSTAQICVDNLVDAALAAGGHDNVTVVVADLVDDGRVRENIRRRKRNVFIALGGLLAAIVIALVVSFFAIRNSVYLGVKNDNVAVYTGIHRTFLGMKLYSLEDVTTIEIGDLPEDTQNRLREGIAQESIDSAYDTITKYRQQINDNLDAAAQTAETLHSSAEADAAASEAAAADNSADASAEDAEAQPADTTQGGE